MKDAVNRLIVDRQALDRGFSRGFVISGVAHLALVGVAVAGTFLTPKKPPINIVQGRIIELPRGSGGSPSVPEAAPAPAPPKPEAPKPELPKPEPPKKKEIIKPPTDEPKKGVPLLDSKKKKMTTATPTAVPIGVGGTSRGAEALGLGIGRVGPGVLDGSDLSGDWYMGSVVQRILMIWRSRIRQELATPILVRFTILADGSVTDVEVVQSSGVQLLDMAARSAIQSAAPFKPLPKHYDDTPDEYCNATRCTRQARFTR